MWQGLWNERDGFETILRILNLIGSRFSKSEFCREGTLYSTLTVTIQAIRGKL